MQVRDAHGSVGLRDTRTSRPAIPASAPSWPQQRHGHVPTRSLLLPRVLQPSAFHTLLHTRAHQIALIIQQTPALCCALVHSTWQRQEGGQREGRRGAQLPLQRGEQLLQHQLSQELSGVSTAPAQPSPALHVLLGVVPGCAQSTEGAGRREHCERRG